MDNKGKTDYSDSVDRSVGCNVNGGLLCVPTVLEDGNMSGADDGRVTVWQTQPQSISESLPNSPDPGQQSLRLPCGDSAGSSLSSRSPGSMNLVYGLSVSGQNSMQLVSSNKQRDLRGLGWMGTATIAIDLWADGALNRHELAASIDAIQMPRPSRVPIALVVVLALAACILAFGGRTSNRLSATEVARTEAVAW